MRLSPPPASWSSPSSSVCDDNCCTWGCGGVGDNRLSAGTRVEYFWSSYKSKRSSSETCFEEDKNCQHQHQNEQVIVGNIIINERENQHCHHHHHTQYHYKEEYQITLMDPRPYFMRLSLIQYQHRSLYHIHTLFLIVSFFHSIYHTRLAYTRKSTIAWRPKMSESESA